MSEMSMKQIRERIDRQRTQLYLVLMQPTDRYDTASEQGAELMRRHLQWQRDLQARNISLGAGPFGDLGGAQTQQQFQDRVSPQSDMLTASGMYIVVAPSRDAAEVIARAEPFEAAAGDGTPSCSGT